MSVQHLVLPRREGRMDAGGDREVRVGIRGGDGGGPIITEKGAPGAGLTASGIFTVFSRLAADPWSDEEKSTREWAAEESGEEAADAMAEILLAWSEAVRDTFYLPASPPWAGIRCLTSG